MEAIEPKIGIELAGERLRLRLRHRDLAAAEQRMNEAGVFVSLLGPGSNRFWFSNQGGHQAGVLLLAGLLHEKPELTLDQARDWVTFENADYVDERIAAAVEGYLRPFLEGRAKKIAEAAQSLANETQSETSGGANSPDSREPISV